MSFSGFSGFTSNGWSTKFTFGTQSDDSIEGSTLDDIIMAADGDDTISASTGSDTIVGGNGFDTVTFEQSIRDVVIEEFTFSSWIPWAVTKTYYVSTFDASGLLDGYTTIRGSEALYFAADDYTYYLDGTNNAVLAGDDTVSASEDSGAVLTAASLLANDLEYDGDTVALLSVDTVSASGASVALIDGEISYQPGTTFDALAAGEVATDTFSYVVTDGKGGTDTATVTVTITGTNDAPTLSVDDAAITIDENTSAIAISVSAMDLDTGAVLTFSLSGDDATLFDIDATTGDIAFKTAPDFEAPSDANGDNTYDLIVVVSDEHGASAEHAISVSVEDVWDPISLTQSFESEATGSFYNGTAGAAADGDLIDLGTEVDLENVDGLATVDSTDTSEGLLGFDLTWVNTRDSDGISDGDWIGVQSYTGDVGDFSDGSRGYELSDADGLLRLTFDTIDLSARNEYSKINLSLDAFINSTGWETDDLVNIYVETNLGTVSLLDTTGLDIDDLGIEDVWQTLSITLDPEVTEATLIAELDSNSSAEALYVDNIKVEEEFLIEQSFETEAAGSFYNGTAGAAADGDLVDLGVEVDLENVDGLATVDSTTASDGLWGYDLTWVNTRNDSGISDGDWIGVQNYTGTVGEFSDGTQGYELSDADGLLRMNFDEINLTGVGEVTLSLDAFIQSTGWETNDVINIYVETDQGTVALLDTTGQDIDDLNIEGAWTTLTTTLDASVNSAQLFVELDSNSSAEALYVDNIIMTTDPEAVVDDGGSSDEITLISEIQGEGDASDMVGMTVTVSAVITEITYDDDGVTGFYFQEEDADSDGNALTSEGLYVFTGSGYAFEIGDLVEVTGSVTEYYDLTELTSVTSLNVVSSGNDMPEATVVTLSPDTVQNYEALESMRLSVVTGTTDALLVNENYNLDRYGQISISAGILTQPTQIYDAQTEAAEIAALIQANENASLLLDDGSSVQNPTEFAYLSGGAGDDGDGILDSGDDFSDTGTTVRLGAEIDGTVEGVLGYSFEEWTLNVTDTIEFVEGTNTDAREETPEDVGGTLQVASYNVLNYFTTFSGGTGPDGDLDPRGADNQDEFDRQSSKIVEGIIGTGAEVVALQEIENNGTTAISTLVDQLNAAGTDATYAYVDPTGTGDFIGTDAITTGIIYDASAVTLIYSDYIVYEESSADATYAIADALTALVGGSDMGDYQRNRPTVAATFVDNASGETFTVTSSHFKSKGDSGLQDVADAAESWLTSNASSADFAAVQELLDDLYADPNFDQGDGQGFWNQVRLDASVELADWVATEYGADGTGVSNYLLLGDMNAYAEEDPVQYLDDDAELVDLIDTYIGQDEAYSYVFDGQQGTLDQGFADDSLAEFVTGVTEWHTNADEPDLIGYDSSYNDEGFYNDGVYAASDHDPLIIGLDLTATDDFVFA